MWIAAPIDGALPLRDRRPADDRRPQAVPLRRAALRGQIGLFFEAVQRTSVVNAQLISAMQPALVLLVAGKMFGERVTRHDVGWTVVAFVGVAVVLLASSGQPEVSPLGQPPGVREPLPLDDLLPRGQAGPRSGHGRHRVHGRRHAHRRGRVHALCAARVERPRRRDPRHATGCGSCSSCSCPAGVATW